MIHNPKILISVVLNIAILANIGAALIIMGKRGRRVRLANNFMNPSALSQYFANVHGLMASRGCSFAEGCTLTRLLNPHLYQSMQDEEIERKRLENEARESELHARRNSQLANAAVMSVIPPGLRTMCGLPQKSSDAEVRAKYAEMIEKAADTSGMRPDPKNETISTKRIFPGRDIPVVNPASELFGRAVQGIMAETGISYLDAWKQAKRDYSDLYAQMQSTSGKGAHPLQ